MGQANELGACNAIARSMKPSVIAKLYCYAGEQFVHAEARVRSVMYVTRKRGGHTGHRMCVRGQTSNPAVVVTTRSSLPRPSRGAAGRSDTETRCKAATSRTWRSLPATCSRFSKSRSTRRSHRPTATTPSTLKLKGKLRSAHASTPQRTCVRGRWLTPAARAVVRMRHADARPLSGSDHGVAIGHTRLGLGRVSAAREHQLASPVLVCASVRAWST